MKTPGSAFWGLWRGGRRPRGMVRPRALTRANGAVFYLVSDPNDPPIPGSSKPGKFATAFSVPKNVNNGSRSNDPFPTAGSLGAA